jgi:hypothetical protein
MVQLTRTPNVQLPRELEPETTVMAAGEASVSSTPVAVDGPSLVTVMV